MSAYIVIFVTLLSTLFAFLRYKYTYWDQLNIPQLKTHFLFGNMFLLKSFRLGELTHEVYQTFRGKAKIAGVYLFTRPRAVILDLDLAKAILIKDFNKFVDRSAIAPEAHEILTTNLFRSGGESWRKMRTKLSPTFTSGKMKFMFPSMVSVTKEFGEAFEQKVRESPSGSVELHDLMARFTTDVVGSCIFGIKCNSLMDPNVEFRRMGNLVFFNKYRSVKWRLFKDQYSQLLKLVGFKVKRFNPQLQAFFMRIVSETVNAREQQNIQRNDFVDLLIEIRNKRDERGELGLTMEEMAAHMFVFFAAGFETSSSNMSCALFELARNPEVQKKLRGEILDVLKKHDNELSYEAMMEMTYLDQVITETLRKYPALSNLSRVSNQEYQVPGTNIKLEKGTTVLIPIKEIHYDPDIYDNPHEFRPERFNPGEENKRHPQAFLGFGDGPRNCIGLRFGRMQVKVGLITLLKSFEFSVSEKMPNAIEISPKSFVLVPAKGVWVSVHKL